MDRAFTALNCDVIASDTTGRLRRSGLSRSPTPACPPWVAPIDRGGSRGPLIGSAGTTAELPQRRRQTTNRVTRTLICQSGKPDLSQARRHNEITRPAGRTAALHANRMEDATGRAHAADRQTAAEADGKRKGLQKPSAQRPVRSVRRRRGGEWGALRRIHIRPNWT